MRGRNARAWTNLLVALLAALLTVAMAGPPVVRADPVDLGQLVRWAQAGQLEGGSQVTANGQLANAQGVSDFVKYQISPMVSPWADPARGWAYTNPGTGQYFTNYPYAAPAAPQPVAEIKSQPYNSPPPSNFVTTWAAYSGYAFRRFMSNAGQALSGVHMPYWGLVPGAANVWDQYYGSRYATSFQE